MALFAFALGSHTAKAQSNPAGLPPATPVQKPTNQIGKVSAAGAKEVVVAPAPGNPGDKWSGPGQPGTAQPGTAPTSPNATAPNALTNPEAAPALSSSPAPAPVGIAVPASAPQLQGEAHVYALPQVPPVAAVPQGPPKTRFPFGLFLDISPLWLRSRGYDLFSKNDISTRIGLTMEADVLELPKKTYLSVDVNGSIENASDKVMGGLSTELSAMNLGAGARIRRDWHPLFSTHAIALGGVSRLKTTLGSGDANIHWLPAIQIGAGISSSLPGDAKVRPGVLVEGGYYLSGSADLRLTSSNVDNAIAQQSASLGSLNRSGAYLRFAIFARY